MKTLETAIVTSVLTAVAIVGGTFGFLYGGGNIKIERNEQMHSKQVIIDGETTKDSKWIELKGYCVSIDLKDEVYFGNY